METKRKNFKCDTCDYSATQRSNLKQHTHAVHLKVKNYKCTQCSYKCGLKTGLNRHIKTVHLKVKNYKCTQCSYKAGTNHNLKTHIKIVHLKTQDFQCDHCDKPFSRKQHLNEHINSTHKKIKRFWCDVCDFSSYQRSSFVPHSNSIHLEKKIKCDHVHCDKAFSQKGNLDRHVIRIHKKLKSYNCELCNYTSCINYELKSHSIQRHAGKNPSLSDLIKEALKDQMIVSVENITVYE
jgi:hypothetical protein